MKILYDLSAAVITLVLILPVGLIAAAQAFTHVILEFPGRVHEIFDKLYNKEL